MKKSASYSVDPIRLEILRAGDILGIWEDGAREREERQRLGRYRMIEAAEAIVRQDAQAPFRVHSAPPMGDDGWPEAGAYDELYDFEERAGNEVKALIASVQSGDLPVYLPGRTERHRVVDQVGIYHEEAYWDDLNVWLAANEPRTTRVFAFPDPTQDSGACDPVAAETQQAPAELAAPVDWKQQVRDAATEWCRERHAAGKPKPTKTAVADEMAVWCRNNDVATDGGKKPDAEYIRRHVLNRWTNPN